MLKWATIGLGLALGVCFALLICAGYMKRSAWINERIAALSAPASFAYAANNSALARKGEKPRLVLIGDSRIAQWPAAAWPDTFEVINRGIGGETSAQLAQRFGADALALEADVILIQAGINDLVAASLMDPDQGREVARKTTETLRRIAGEASAAGRRVLIATIIAPARPDMFRLPVWDGSLADLVEGVNADLKSVPWPPGASLIDLSSVLVSGDKRTLDDEFRRDTLHLNATGYKRLTEMLTSHLQSVLEAVPRDRTKG